MKFWGAILFSVWASSSLAQSTFQNLDFEQSNPIIIQGGSYYPYSVTAVSAFPHWIVSVGGVQQTQVTQNDPSTGATWVTLIGPGSAFGSSPLGGNYSVLLQGGGTSSDASMSQTGFIPTGTQSLLFAFSGNKSDLQVKVNGQIVTTAYSGSGLIYDADVSAWAGRTEQITFSALEDFESSSNLLLDDITFSPNPVPEPSALALLGIGSFAASCMCRIRIR